MPTNLTVYSSLFKKVVLRVALLIFRTKIWGVTLNVIDSFSNLFKLQEQL